MQIFADVTKRKIITTNQPKMAGALGAAMCAFVGAGIFEGFHQVEEIISPSKEFIPNPENEEIYDTMFKDYQNIYKSLKSTYQRSNIERFNIN